MKVSHFLKLHCSSCLIGESSITHCLNCQLNSPHLEAELKLDITRVALYSLRNDRAQKTRFYCCARNIVPWTSHLTPSQYCWSVTSSACMEVCLPSRNLEMDCVTPLFHCWYAYYLETADTMIQPFLHGANTPHYALWILLRTPRSFLAHNLILLVSGAIQDGRLHILWYKSGPTIRNGFYST
jgi:hypothetical protein